MYDNGIYVYRYSIPMNIDLESMCIDIVYNVYRYSYLRMCVDLDMCIDLYVCKQLYLHID